MNGTAILAIFSFGCTLLLAYELHLANKRRNEIMDLIPLYLKNYGPMTSSTLLDCLKEAGYPTSMAALYSIMSSLESMGIVVSWSTCGIIHDDTCYPPKQRRGPSVFHYRLNETPIDNAESSAVDFGHREITRLDRR